MRDVLWSMGCVTHVQTICDGNAGGIAIWECFGGVVGSLAALFPTSLGILCGAYLGYTAQESYQEPM